MPQLCTHYDTLKIARNAPDAVIRAAYKTLMQRYHPDKFSGAKPEGLRISKIINQSYEILIDPTKRAKYDHWLETLDAKPKTSSKVAQTGGIDKSTKHGQYQAQAKPAQPKNKVQALLSENLDLPRANPENVEFRGMYFWLRGFIRRLRLRSKHFFASTFPWTSQSNQIDWVARVSKPPLSTLSERAFDLFEKSRYSEIMPLAKGGDPIAKLMLAAMYDRGNGIAKNSQSAKDWYQQAFRELLQLAEQGDAVAQFFLATMYSEGLGVFQDNQQALNWLNKSVAHGYAKAQYELGCLYLAGHAVPKDLSHAIYLLTQAALQGLVDAQSRLGLIYEAGQAEIKDGKLENQQKSCYWYTKAAEQGDYASQFALGKMYAGGRGAPQNIQKAIYWYTKSAEQGWPFAQSALAAIYAHGGGVPQNYMLAHMWWGIAAAMGHENAGKYSGEIAQEMTSSQIHKAKSLTHEWLKNYGRL